MDKLSYRQWEFIFDAVSLAGEGSERVTREEVLEVRQALLLTYATKMGGDSDGR